METILVLVVGVLLGGTCTFAGVWLAQRGNRVNEDAYLKTIGLNRYLCQLLKTSDPLVFREMQQHETNNRWLAASLIPGSNGNVPPPDKSSAEIAAEMDAQFDESGSGQPRMF